MAISEFLPLVKDLVTALALIVGAYVAIEGLNTWKRQLRGTAEFDLARRILGAAYRLRNAINTVRGPMMTSGEMAVAMKESGIEMAQTDPDFQFESTRTVYARRWKPVEEAMEQLEVEAIQAEAIWGDKARQLTADIKRSVSSLAVALDLVLRDMYKPDRGILDAASRVAFRERIYRMSDDVEKDKYASELNQRIRASEALVRPRLEM